MSPHADGPPAGLWWWDRLPEQDRFRVIVVYFERLVYIISKRDQSQRSLKERRDRVCQDFEQRCKGNRGTPETIEEIIRLVTAPNTTSRSVKERGCYKTLKGVSLELNLKPLTVYYWFRRLDKIARELYPSLAPPSAVTITEEAKAAIRLEYAGNGNARELAKRYGLTPARIGQIVKAEKKMRREFFAAERAAREEPATDEPYVDVASRDPKF
jgi:hypothetical protein